MKPTPRIERRTKRHLGPPSSGIRRSSGIKQSSGQPQIRRFQQLARGGDPRCIEPNALAEGDDAFYEPVVLLQVHGIHQLETMDPWTFVRDGVKVSWSFYVRPELAEPLR